MPDAAAVDSGSVELKDPVEAGADKVLFILVSFPTDEAIVASREEVDRSPKLGEPVRRELASN